MLFYITHMWLEKVKDDLKEKRLERDKVLMSGPDVVYIRLCEDVRWLKDYIRYLEDNMM